MLSRKGYVLAVGCLCCLDVMLARPGTRVLTLGLNAVALGLAVGAVRCLKWERPCAWVFVFLLVVPLGLASFAWVSSVSSDGFPVAIYLFSVIVWAGKKRKTDSLVEASGAKDR